MPIRRFSIVAVYAWLALATASPLAGVPPPLVVGQGERLLVLAPHPDDETLSAAGLIHQVLQRQGSVREVVVTAGDAYVEGVERDTGKRRPQPADFLRYGETRLEEARRAAQVLGEGAIRLDLLGFSDGAIYPMLVSHWRRVHPDKSAFTGFDHVPYPEAEDEGMVQDGEDLRRQLVAILKNTHPTLIVFPDVMENDSDHAALGMFALLAISEWLSHPSAWPDKPRLLAYLIHWQNRWPPGSMAEAPVDLSSQPLYLPDDLPLRGHTRTCLSLGALDKELKWDALAQYRTQQRVMGAFLSAFVRSTECFSQLKTEDSQGIENVIKQWQHVRKAFDSRPISRRAIGIR